MINEILNKRRERLVHLEKMRRGGEKSTRVTCPDCSLSFEKTEVKKNYKCCPHCNHHFSMTPMERIKLLEDERSFREMHAGLVTSNPLGFTGYEEKLKEARRATNHSDAIVCGTMKIGGIPAAVGVMDPRFFMGSMGTVVGEKICRLTETARRKKLPLILISASGGARMQEGLFSLMQMAKTAAAIQRFQLQGGFFLSCLTNPTTGGVSASFANLGDIILAEPKVLICFAGPRVIEQTIGEKLPEGFQRAEFLLENGMVDMVVDRRNLRQVVEKLIKMHA